jgi:hypothetical protein
VLVEILPLSLRVTVLEISALTDKLIDPESLDLRLIVARLLTAADAESDGDELDDIEFVVEDDSLKEMIGESVCELLNDDDTDSRDVSESMYVIVVSGVKLTLIVGVYVFDLVRLIKVSVTEFVSGNDTVGDILGM